MWLQKVPGGGVVGLAYSPDGRTLYTVDTGGWVTAWDVAARAGRRVIRLGTPDRYDARRLTVACAGQFLVIAGRSTTRVWDLATGDEHALLPWEFTQFTPELDPTGRLFVAPDSQGRMLASWDLAERRPGPILLQADPAKADRFGCFSLTRDGQTAAIHTARREIILYDRGECREFARFEPQTAPSRVDAIQFSPDGDTLVLFAGDRAQLWDVSSQSVCVGQIVCSHSVFAFHPTAPVFASLNPDRVLTLFGLQTGQPIRSLDFALGRAVRCVAFAPDGLTCAVGGSNKKFVVFDVDV